MLNFLKIYQATLSVVFALSIVMVGCKKDDSTPKNQDPVFSAQVDGADVALTSCSAEIKDGRLLVLANASDGSRIELSSSATAAGTFTVDKTSDTRVIYDKKVGVSPYFSIYSSAAAGSLKLTKFNIADSLVSGELSCGVKQTLSQPGVATISLKFENIKISKLAAQTQNMSAKLNGVSVPEAMSFAFVSPLDGALTLILLDAEMEGNVGIGVSKNAAPGTYGLGSVISGSLPYGLYSTYSNQAYDCTGGILVITKHDKTAKQIAGTFQFNAFGITNGQTLSITSGSFSLNY